MSKLKKYRVVIDYTVNENEFGANSSLAEEKTRFAKVKLQNAEGFFNEPGIKIRRVVVEAAE